MNKGKKQFPAVNNFSYHTVLYIHQLEWDRDPPDNHVSAYCPLSFLGRIAFRGADCGLRPIVTIVAWSV